MTTFCANCGNQIRSGGRFCQACGTPVSPASAAARESSGYQSNIPPSSPYQSPAYYGAPPPVRSGTNWTKVILITLAIIFLLGGTVVVGTFLFIRSAVNQVVTVRDVEDGGKAVDLKLPGGQVKIGTSTLTEEELGMPIYPGARMEKDGAVSISGGSENRSGWIGAATFITEDSIEDVAAFYSEKLGENVHRVDSAQDNRRTVLFNTQTEKGWRSVAIRDEGAGEVKITITSIQGTSAP